MEKDYYDYANIFKTYIDTNGVEFYNLMNSLNITGEIDPQLYEYDEIYSFTSFYDLSNKYYNTPKLWWTILLANDIKNPFDVVVGQRVKILKSVAINEILSKINNI